MYLSVLQKVHCGKKNFLDYKKVRMGWFFNIFWLNGSLWMWDKNGSSMASQSVQLLLFYRFIYFSRYECENNA